MCMGSVETASRGNVYTTSELCHTNPDKQRMLLDDVNINLPIGGASRNANSWNSVFYIKQPQ